ncbi:MAG TPA: hypothetical protein VLF93_07005 [Candidatus Saccharimonadales bacterium]|nr:hypothetical protein [Candidatus Saccharimonadales bacterium]
MTHESIPGHSSAEDESGLKKLIADIELEGDAVVLSLTTPRPITEAYVLCSLPEEDEEDQRPEQRFDVPTDNNVLPSKYTFTRPDNIFSFRVVAQSPHTPTHDIFTVHPGNVIGSTCLMLEQGWTFLKEAEKQKPK